MSEGAKVCLYTRPRHFGKSLDLSMSDAFFNIKYPKDNGWFDGLKVSDCKECQGHKDAYPVIISTLKIWIPAILRNLLRRSGISCLGRIDDMSKNQESEIR
ncbi:MAG: AAA family ATPase [Candidatus Methanomethylophilaceae archaeon]